jgi:hypothetical protein
MLEDIAPLVRAQEEKARRAQFEAPPSISTMFKGKRVRALGSKVLFREPSETFHEFLIALLLSTLGKKWHDEQAQTAPAQRHAVWGWLQEWRDLGARTRPADHPADQPHSAAPTGPAQAVLSLAEDLYRVQQQLGKLPKRLRERLRLRDQFQGARYEAAIAATFIRCGFKLTWNENKAVKGPEFIADHPATGDSLAVEVKSRHRPGVLHVRGDAAEPEAVPATIEGLFADALRQNPGDRAFAVFIDVNLPPQTPLADGRPRWVLDVEKIVAPYQQNPDAGVVRVAGRHQPALALPARRRGCAPAAVRAVRAVALHARDQAQRDVLRPAPRAAAARRHPRQRVNGPVPSLSPSSVSKSEDERRSVS